LFLTRRTRTALGFFVALLLAAAVVVLPWLLRSGPSLTELSDEAGSEELEQIFGSSDAGELDGSGVGPAVAVDDDQTIHGQVVRPNGEPAAGASISAQATATGDLYEAFADAGGLFDFGSLPDGLYALEARLDGYGPAMMIGVTPGGGSTRLVLQAGREIEGFVLRDGEPVPRAVVHLGGPGTFPQRSVVADAAGRYRIAGVRPGRYELIATAVGAGSGFGSTLVLDEPSGPPVRMDLPVYDAPEVVVRVVDRATGEPVDDGVVTLTQASLHVISLHRVLDFGEAVVDFLPFGWYHARVRAPGYLPWEGPFRVGTVDGEVTVELSRGARVSGTVRDEANNELAGVELTAWVETPSGGRWELRRSLFDDFHRLSRPDGTPFWVQGSGFDTDAEGQYALTGLPSGDAVVVARSPGYAPRVSPRLTLTAGEVYEPLDFVLTEGRRVRGRVEDAGGGRVSEAWVTVRPPDTPSWSAPPGRATDSFGMFEFEDIGDSVTLSVRHPDFAPAELTVEVPPEGLDDLVIRLSGEQLPQLSGRLFTRGGRPAVGARVWVLHGDSELPACRATVNVDGWFRATHCSAPPERLLASYPGHAPLLADLGGDVEPRDWDLQRGGEIEVVTQRTPLITSVEPLFNLPSAHWPRPEVDLDRWSRHLVTNVAPGEYRVQCASEGHGTQVIDVEVANEQRVEALCPSLERLSEVEIIVTDRQGSPVQDALVFVDGIEPTVRALTDARGRVAFETEPGHWANAEAFHEGWGRGGQSFYIGWESEAEPISLQLEHGIAGEAPEEFLAELQGWGVVAVVDNRSVIVDRVEGGSAADGLGLRRRDALLWARPVSEHRYSIGVRRNGEVVTFDLSREPESE